MALKENSTLKYIHQDHLTGTSLMTNNVGAQIGSTMKYRPFGETFAGSVPTDKKFTGQRLDGTGLYYYGARYYDPLIGRFISPDTIIPNSANPQSFNRYSYCLNNPLNRIDPDGHDDYLRLVDLGNRLNESQQNLGNQINNNPAGNWPGYIKDFMDEVNKIRKEVSDIFDRQPKNGERNPDLPPPYLPTFHFTDSGSNTKDNGPSLPVDKNGWKWDDPKAAACFAAALALTADDASGIGVFDDPAAALAAFAGLGISVWENREIISDAIDSAIMWFAEHTKNIRPSTWDKNSGKRPGDWEKGDKRRPYKKPPKKR